MSDKSYVDVESYNQFVAIVARDFSSVVERLLKLQGQVDNLQSAVKSVKSPVVDEPKQLVSNRDEVVNVIRHRRFYNEDGSVGARGGATFAFKIDYTDRKVYAGVSFCTEEDVFSKDEGVRIASHRRDRTPIVFDYVYPSDLGLVDRLINEFVSEQGVEVKYSTSLKDANVIRSEIQKVHSVLKLVLANFYEEVE